MRREALTRRRLRVPVAVGALHAVRVQRASNAHAALTVAVPGEHLPRRRRRRDSRHGLRRLGRRWRRGAGGLVVAVISAADVRKAVSVRQWY